MVTLLPVHLTSAPFTIPLPPCLLHHCHLSATLLPPCHYFILPPCTCCNFSPTDPDQCPSCKHSRSIRQQIQPLKPAPPPSVTGSVDMDLAAMHAHVPHRDPPHQGSTIAHILLSMSRHHHQTILRNEPVMEPNASGGTNWSFFHPVQVHMVEPVQSASVTMNTPSQIAMVPSHGMDLQAQPGKTSKADWSQLTVAPSASIGRCHKAVLPQTTPIDTGVQGAEKQVMELKHVLRQRGHNPLTPYCWEAWEAELAQHGLQCRYPKLVQGLRASFDLGIPCIHHSYTLPNHCSISTLNSVYNSIIENEFAASQYISPFTCTPLEASVGPFQMLPLSLVPKTSKPGKYRAVHDFSHPYNPLPAVTSINSSINSDDFPCT